MSASLSWYLARRYLTRRRGDRFVSLVALVSLLGMTIGIFALVVVTAVMNGFERELQERLLAVIPHGFIDARDGRMDDWRGRAEQLRKDPRVVGVAPYIASNAMLVNGSRMRGASVAAVDPSIEAAVSDLRKHMVAGSFLPDSGQQYAIVMGDILARQLDLDIGDAVTVVLPKVTVTPLGVFPRQRRFVLAGVFSSGSQLDASAALIHLADGQRLLQLGDAVQGLRVATRDLHRAPQWLPALAHGLDDSLVSRDWSQTQGSLFQAVKMEKTMVMLLLLIIVAVAAFNIVSIMTMMVADKRGDIAVLRTMGATPATIARCFLWQGFTIALLGLALGLLLGVPAALYVGEIVQWLEQLSGRYLFDPQVYFVTRIPSVLRWQDLGVIATCALVLGLLATLYPARRAAAVAPAEALRYE
ncbi:MAG: lipoprotein-releasing ABC transporter permease subunit [Spongiibacteraceae bacterium]|jgi:lipoprotein-releasing system permease protein|nr:lipoprotein-releasing ABC transporter permease subunit [Spongiibacteraceae bacterium]